MSTQNSNLIFILICACVAICLSAENRVSVQSWGNVNGTEVKKYTLRNANNQEVDIISYGAKITAIRTPDKTGKIDDVVLGFDNLEAYVSKDNKNFGATIGRVANRIANGQFTIDGVQYQVSRNSGNNSIHGGLYGWSTKLWKSTIENDTVVMTLISEDGDQGFPGTATATLVFKLTDDGKFIIEMKSTTTKATIINLTNHSYFNLAGHGTNAAEIYKHQITVNADRWTVTGDRNIPTGEIRPVANSIMDLRKPTVLGDVINEVEGGGYDSNFCIEGCICPDKVRLVANVLHPGSGRTLEVTSNQPGVQLYTANSLPEPGGQGVVGKENKQYFKHAGFCLETQNYPDAINHENFPNSIVRPGETYYHIVTYQFGVQA